MNKANKKEALSELEILKENSWTMRYQFKDEQYKSGICFSSYEADIELLHKAKTAYKNTEYCQHSPNTHQIHI